MKKKGKKDKKDKKDIIEPKPEENIESEKVEEVVVIEGEEKPKEETKEGAILRGKRNKKKDSKELVKNEEIVEIKEEKQIYRH